MVDSNKNKNFICKTNLTDKGFANSARAMIWCSVSNFRSENIQGFRGLYILNHIPQFCPRFIMDSVPNKTVREFLVGRWTPLQSS